MMVEGEVLIIAEIEKNRQEHVAVSLAEYRGFALLDIRVMADSRHHGEGRIPTKKGVAIKVERLPELRASLDEAERAARERGLLP